MRNPETTEILGAFIGDGWIQKDLKAFYIVGHPSEDKNYINTVLKTLVEKNFCKVKPRLFSYWGVYGLPIYKKQVIHEMISLGCVPGLKSLSAEIPRWVIDSKNFEVKKSIIRGVFDTDGTFWCERSRYKGASEWRKTHNHHPELRFTSCSQKLLRQMGVLLNEFGITSKLMQKARKGNAHGREVNDSFALNVRRGEDIEHFFQEIKPHNERHLTRYNLWKKFGHLPPYSTLKERKIMLEEKTV